MNTPVVGFIVKGEIVVCEHEVAGDGVCVGFILNLNGITDTATIITLLSAVIFHNPGSFTTNHCPLEKTLGKIKSRVFNSIPNVSSHNHYVASSVVVCSLGFFYSTIIVTFTNKASKKRTEYQIYLKTL